MTKQMLAYSGKGSFAQEVLDVRDLVEQMSALLEVSIPKIITIDYELGEQAAMVEADPGQLQQVVMNRLFLQGIYFECTPILPSKTGGR